MHEWVHCHANAWANAWKMHECTHGFMHGKCKDEYFNTLLMHKCKSDAYAWAHAQKMHTWFMHRCMLNCMHSYSYANKYNGINACIKLRWIFFLISLKSISNFHNSTAKNSKQEKYFHKIHISRWGKVNFKFSIACMHLDIYKMLKNLLLFLWLRWSSFSRAHIELKNCNIYKSRVDVKM